MLSSGVPRPRVSAFHHSASSLPPLQPSLPLFWSRSFPAPPLGVRETWEVPQEPLRDGEIHKGSLPQSILSQRQPSLLNTASYYAYTSVRRLWGPQAHEISTHKMCLNPLQGGEKVCVSERREYLKLVAGGASPSVIPRGKEGIDKTTQQDCCSSRVELAGIHTMPFLHLHSHIFQLWAVTHSKYSSLCISQKTGITIPVICTLQSAPQIFGSSKYKCNK